MPPWFSHVVSCQNKESNINSSRWLQLSTVGLDLTPRVRTVVFRGWTDFYEMKLFTDKRSQKISELESNNNVEICWFFYKSSCQFRFRGKSKIVCGEESVNNWNQLSENAKKMWEWPSPGTKFKKKSQDILTKEEINSLDNFVLMKIEFDQVEQLLLQKTIHFRRRWIKKDEWIEERINP